MTTTKDLFFKKGSFLQYCYYLLFWFCLVLASSVFLIWKHFPFLSENAISDIGHPIRSIHDFIWKWFFAVVFLVTGKCPGTKREKNPCQKVSFPLVLLQARKIEWHLGKSRFNNFFQRNLSIFETCPNASRHDEKK